MGIANDSTAQSTSLLIQGRLKDKRSSSGSHFVWITYDGGFVGGCVVGHDAVGRDDKQDN